MFGTGPNPNRQGATPTKPARRDRRDYMRDFMAKKRAAERDLKIPAPVDADRRAACLADPLLFLSTYFPDTYYNPWTECQTTMAHTIADAAKYGLKKAIAAPRGDGKTKTTEGLIVYCTLSGLISFSCIIAATGELSQRILENLKRLLTSPLLAEDFPEVCLPLIALGDESKKANNQTVNGKPTRINWTKKFIRLPAVEGSESSGAIIYPLSIEGAIRGLCLGPLRPDFVLIDDPETRESAASEYQVAIREEILRKDVAGLKGARHKLGQVALVTIQNEISLAYRLTDLTKNPSWGGQRFRALEAWPERSDLWDEYMHRRKAAQEAGDQFARDAFHFYRENRVEMDRGAQLNNPYRFDADLLPDGTPKQLSAIQACFDFIADEGIEAFRSEYQNDPRTAAEAETSQLSARLVESRINPKLLRGELPDDAKAITVAIDVGKYACHWAAIAFGEEARAHVLEYGVAEVHGMNAQASPQAIERAVVATLNQWREEIATKTWRSPTSELELKASFGLVDSGDGNLTDAIYSWVRSLPPHPPIAASKGYGQGQRKLAKSGSRRIDWHQLHAVLIPESGVWLYEFNSDFWKRWVHSRWSTPPWPEDAIQQTPFSLAIHAPDRIRQHQPFSQHQVAELYRELFVPGRGMVRGWDEVSPNNHWLDAVSMACAAAMAAGLIPVDPIAPTPTPETDVTPAPKRQASEPRRQTSLGRLNGRRTYLARPRR